jgi:hypothetical protein
MFGDRTDVPRVLGLNRRPRLKNGHSELLPLQGPGPFFRSTVAYREARAMAIYRLLRNAPLAESSQPGGSDLHDLVCDHCGQRVVAIHQIKRT